MCDKGSEFNNQKFLTHFKSLNDAGKIYFKNPEIHNSGLAIADRAVRSVRDIFKRLFVKNYNLIWINSLNDVEQTYNSSFYKGIKAVPIMFVIKKRI